LGQAMIHRFSSRNQAIDQTFLNERLREAQSYDRIAGYFSSSILEVAGEALDSISGVIRVVCNSDLQPDDVKTAQAANYAIRREWCAFEPEKLGVPAQPRFKRLFELLRSRKMIVRVLPSDKFGLVHGKAGVITMKGGRQTAFMGSTNETYSAFRMNYELVWEDDSGEAVQWVQDEFDALWNHPLAQELAEFVVDDIERLSRRVVVPGVEAWRNDPEPAAPIVESPVYRKEFGLWAHQKYFVKTAFEAHQTPHGARLVLADMVGLGKTLQLAMAAQLMALYGTRPILVLAPKTLLWQWQEELTTMLDMPSAVWTGKAWVDENAIEHPVAGPQGIKKCPRRVGLVSQGLITCGSETADHLRGMRFECVIVDEAHRSRRRNLGVDKEGEAPDPNNLMRFLFEISPRTKSMLLATATPVQLYPVEAWDLLSVLAMENEHVLGNAWSHWRKAPEALESVIGQPDMPADGHGAWSWVRNPFPFSREGRDFEMIRRALHVDDREAVLSGDTWDKLRPPDQAKVRSLAQDFLPNHNPFIRCIIRRTREYLENTINPETNEPYLKPVKVELLGEDDAEAIVLPPYLWDAYAEAEEFCRLVGARVKGSGFLKTLLLRRVGSTICAGQMTAQKMLESWDSLPEVEEEEDLPDYSEFRSLTPSERQHLQAFVDALSANQERDPKYQVVLDCLRGRGWLDDGCIIFSQYFDSVWWLAEQLTRELPEERIGIYGGGQRSGIMVDSEFERLDREEIKRMVKHGELRLLLGTDAASEGLNLQKLGTLMNLDLPWNPTRLEQRKGRIQRIGQLRDTVFVYNMRYKNSVEDRVHELLSDRLENIFSLFGQIPDVLEDVWIDIALGKIEKARQTIAAMPRQHPFEIKYHRIESVPWETCARVLDSQNRKKHLSSGW
jgi:superfamily II DNA or RNA helicase